MVIFVLFNRRGVNSVTTDQPKSDVSANATSPDKSLLANRYALLKRPSSARSAYLFPGGLLVLDVDDLYVVHTESMSICCPVKASASIAGTQPLQLCLHVLAVMVKQHCMGNASLGSLSICLHNDMTHVVQVAVKDTAQQLV